MSDSVPYWVEGILRLSDKGCRFEDMKAFATIGRPAAWHLVTHLHDHGIITKIKHHKPWRLGGGSDGRQAGRVMKLIDREI